MKKPTQSQPHPKAFTLVELLVVILILVTLASLGFLGLQRARSAAYMVQSTTRIKNLGSANALYAAENNGRYVPVVTSGSDGAAGVQWHFNPDFLGPIIGNTEFLKDVKGYEGVDGVPEAVLDPVTVKAKQKFWSRISGSYGYNEEGILGGIPWGSKDVNAQQSLNTVKNPSRMFNFITATDWVVGLRGKDLWFSSPAKAVEGKTGDGKIAFRHNKKAIAVFYDGHTEMITKQDIRTFDARGGIRSAFWGGDR